MMKNFLITKVLLNSAIFAPAFLLMAGSTFAATNSYYIDQSRMEIIANPKTHTASGVVKVTSNSNATIRIKIVPKLWTLDENAAIEYLEPTEGQYNLIKNILVNPLEFPLELGKTRLVRFMVRLPQRQEDAEYPFQLLFEPTEALAEKPSGAQNEPAGIQQALNIVPIFSTTVYAYQGNPQPKAAVESFTCAYDAQKQQIATKVRLANTGTKHARLLGSVIVNRQEAGGNFQPVDIVKLRGGNLILNFPSVPRTLDEVILPSEKIKTLSAGEYKLELQLADERNLQPALQAVCNITVP